MIRRLYVEKRENFRQEAATLLEDIRRDLGLHEIASLRYLLRYDVEGIPEDVWETSKQSLFAEPAIEILWETRPWQDGEPVFGVE